MEEKKKIRIIAEIVIMILVAFLVYGISKNVNIGKNTVPKTIDVKIYDECEYYIINNDYSGEYDLQITNLSEDINENSENEEEFKKRELMSYSEYATYCNKWGLKQKYTDSSKKYIVFSYLASANQTIEARLAAVKYFWNKVDLYIWDNVYPGTSGISAYTIVIPTDRNIRNINIVPVYTMIEFEEIRRFHGPEVSVDKPIVYLYPTKETEVSVKLLKEKSITCSYPKYTNSWKVLARPSGKLRDLDTGRNLYSLYYENKSNIEFKVQKDGFIVKGEDVAAFLEEKLAMLGLTEREAEEFIIYWLPKLESNKYNYIRFASMEEINENMPIEINPNPDTIIRVLMTYKGLDKTIEIEEQQLKTPERKGFVAVEWGGTEIK